MEVTSYHLLVLFFGKAGGNSTFATITGLVHFLLAKPNFQYVPV